MAGSAVGRRVESGGWIEKWNPEDAGFWEREGKYVARRNLIFSIFAEHLGFSVWQVYSIVAALIGAIGFDYSSFQLFTLAALPGLVGATMRFPYTFMVPIIGGRNWTVISALLLLIPSVLLGVLVQHPQTTFWMFALAAATAGFGGGNFASSMANISYFYPGDRKGFALGLNAAGGNIGVSFVQVLVPVIITAGAVGSLVGDSQAKSAADGSTSQVWVQSAGFMWVPLILIAALCAYLFMDNLRVQSAPFREQAIIVRRKHTWIMSLLYTGTFGSFIGYSASFPLLISGQFPGNAGYVKYAWLGPLVGSLVRPLGGWMADRLGGARVTFWNFAVMIAAVFGVLAFLYVGSFAGFLISFLLLFMSTGIGNGSTFRMIPVIYRTHHERLLAGGGDEEDGDRVRRDSLKEAGAALGFTSAIAAYGAFLIPQGYGLSIEATGGPHLALFGFVAFYAVCVSLTWYFYYRRGAEIPC